MPRLPPRVVIAGTHSGAGKTTVVTGLLATLAGRGVRVGAAKVGPDFIDPGYHGLACGRPSRNLDVRLCGEDVVGAVAARAGAGCDLLVVEGVMGLFDGAGSGPAGSTAHVATLLGAPVVLVVDAAALSGSVAAVVHGFGTFDPAVAVAGVILNRVGSDGHEQLLREALAPLGLPVLGALRRDHRLTWRDRHLGLVPVAERPDEVRRSLAVLAEVVGGGVDLEALVAMARTAAPRSAGEIPVPPPVGGRAVVALAGGPAFSFTYPELPEALAAAGAEVVPFDPRSDPSLPGEATALVVGGGFPEEFAAELADNLPLLADVRHKVGAGLPTWAECGGLLWLARSLDGRPLAGVVPADGRMTDRLTLGYRTAVTRAASPIGPPGTTLQGHEFRYSAIHPPGDALDLRGRSGAALAGFATPSLLATYLHVHPAGEPDAVGAFIRSAARADPRRSGGAGATTESVATAHLPIGNRSAIAVGSFHLPSHFVETARNDPSPELRAWMATLPQVVAGLAARWSLRLGEPYQPGGSCSWVAPARDGTGRALVLKVGWLHDEAVSEADGLRAWEGQGTVRLHDAHVDGLTSALLLERCEPGTPLSICRPEPEQDTIVAGLLQRLWVAPPAGHPFRPLQAMCDSWALAFEERLATSPCPLDPGLVRAGLELFRLLPATADEEVLLCTDLHAGNVLAAGREPWLAIDPKPYVGDRTYDPLQHLLNCDERLAADPSGLAGRLSGLLDLDRVRLTQWLFARCVVESLDQPWLGEVAAAAAPA